MTTGVTWQTPIGTTGADISIETDTDYHTDWTVSQVQTRDVDGVAKPLTQHFAYYTDNTKANFGQLKQQWVSGDGIEGDRTATTLYSDDGYFVKANRHAQWGSHEVVSQHIDPATGLLLSQTDANGNTSRYHYDNFNRLTRITTPGMPAVTHAVQQCGESAGDCQAGEGYKLISRQAGTPASDQFLDTLGRTVRVVTTDFDGQPQQTTTEYNRRGQVLNQASPAGSVTYSDFDALGRVTRQTSHFAPEHVQTDFSYQGLTSQITVTPMNGMGNTTPRILSQTVNSEGAVTRVQDAAGHYTDYRYNAAGLPTAIQAPGEALTTAQYNAFGHKSQVSDPNQGQSNFTYNALGELKTLTDANGVTTSYSYDGLGRVTARYRSNGEASAHWDYDNPARGLYGVLTQERLGATHHPFKKDYGYDGMGRLVNITTTLDDAYHSTPTAYRQDMAIDSKFGRATATRYPDGTALYYRYNQNGYSTGESDSADNASPGLRTISAMDHNGLPTQFTYRNNLNTTIGRSTAGTIQSICTTMVNQSCLATSSDQVQFIEYPEYDSFGNLLLRRNHTQDVNEIFNYDIQDRLLSVIKTATGQAEVTTDYRYDLAGNLLHKTDFSTTLDNAYTYGTNDLLARNASTDKAGPNAVKTVQLKTNALGLNLSGHSLTYTYDNNGNMLSNQIQKADGSTIDYRSLSYNANNKPVEITNLTGLETRFEYGSDNLRYRQIKDKPQNPAEQLVTYFFNGGLYEVEMDPASNTTQTRAYLEDYAVQNRTFTNGSQTGSTLYFLHRDRLGSVDTITDSAITATSGLLATMIIEQRSYDAFGKARTTTGGIATDGNLNSAITPRGFTDHQHIDDFDLVHMNGRVYDPALARFVSADPIISNPMDGQTINAYSYVANRPLAYTDPTGYTSEGDGYDDNKNGNTGGYNRHTQHTQAGDCFEVGSRANIGCRENPSRARKILGFSHSYYRPWPAKIDMSWLVNDPGSNDDSSQLTISSDDKGFWAQVFEEDIQIATAVGSSLLNILSYTSTPEMSGSGIKIDSLCNGRGECLDRHASMAHNAKVMMGMVIWIPMRGSRGPIATHANTSLASTTGGSIRNVNKVGGRQNCFNCAVATDALLAGNPASALNSGTVTLAEAQLYFGRSFGTLTSLTRIEAQMIKAGHGARGVVFGNRPKKIGHYFNVVNQNGTVRFLDGQSGKEFSAVGQGFANFTLMRTN